MKKALFVLLILTWLLNLCYGEGTTNSNSSTNANTSVATNIRSNTSTNTSSYKENAFDNGMSDCQQKNNNNSLNAISGYFPYIYQFTKTTDYLSCTMSEKTMDITTSGFYCLGTAEEVSKDFSTQDSVTVKFGAFKSSDQFKCALDHSSTAHNLSLIMIYQSGDAGSLLYSPTENLFSSFPVANQDTNADQMAQNIGFYVPQYASDYSMIAIYLTLHFYSMQDKSDFVNNFKIGYGRMVNTDIGLSDSKSSQSQKFSIKVSGYSFNLKSGALAGCLDQIGIPPMNTTNGALVSWLTNAYKNFQAWNASSFISQKSSMPVYNFGGFSTIDSYFTDKALDYKEYINLTQEMVTQLKSLAEQVSNAFTNANSIEYYEAYDSINNILNQKFDTQLDKGMCTGPNAKFALLTPITLPLYKTISGIADSMETLSQSIKTFLSEGYNDINNIKTDSQNIVTACNNVNAAVISYSDNGTDNSKDCTPQLIIGSVNYNQNSWELYPLNSYITVNNPGNTNKFAIGLNGSNFTQPLYVDCYMDNQWVSIIDEKTSKDQYGNYWGMTPPQIPTLTSQNQFAVVLLRMYLDKNNPQYCSYFFINTQWRPNEDNPNIPQNNILQTVSNIIDPFLWSNDNATDQAPVFQGFNGNVYNDSKTQDIKGLDTYMLNMVSNPTGPGAITYFGHGLSFISLSSQ